MNTADHPDTDDPQFRHPLRGRFDVIYLSKGAQRAGAKPVQLS